MSALATYLRARTAGGVGAALIAATVACAPQPPATQPGAGTPTTTTMGMAALLGQRAVCAGPAEKVFNLTVRELAVDLGMSTTFNAWTFDGRLPGPTLEVCVGDRVTIHVSNQGTTAHGLDTHALSIDARKYGPTSPGTTLTLTGTARTPGAFMYHCASGSVTDVHIKSGLSGAMIVHRRTPLPPVSRELVVVESAVFGERSADGIIPGTDSSRTLRNDAAFRFFNGRLEHEALPVAVHDRVRVYFVNVGPGVSAVHVIGSMLDAVIDGADTRRDVQTYGVAPGGGAIVDFTIPEAGEFLLVNHDQLGYVPLGLALRFTAAK